MSLKVYNTLTRQKEEFVPLNPPRVKMYVCGPTVYDLLHVGNFRNPVVFNLIRNWLEHLGFNVTFALNFTDVDDKIIDRANRDHRKPMEMAAQYIEEYRKDFASLGLKPHDLNPKVTDSMADIIDVIKKLLEVKKAYVASGDVMYSVKSFAEYGKLSGRNIDDLQAGARVEIDDKKENPLDFALWKAGKPGEPAWPSPWGPGRPGWHIECSAMACKHLGEQIDIHGGGTDLIFPHHENEIAQTEGVTGKTFSKVWMHVQMLNFSGQKMSKSLGNIISLREFLRSYNPEIYKWMILSTHYRSLCEFSDEAVHRAISGLARVYSASSLAQFVLGGGASDSNPKADPTFQNILDTAWKKVEDSLNDDFNTPEAFAALFDVIRVFNSQVKRGMPVTPVIKSRAAAFLQLVKKVGKPMALFQEDPTHFLTTLDDMLLRKMNIRRSDIDIIIKDRSTARTNKDFKKSDELRDKLAVMGISVMDYPGGSFWEVTK